MEWAFEYRDDELMEDWVAMVKKPLRKIPPAER